LLGYLWKRLLFCFEGLLYLATTKNRAAVATNKQNLKALHDAGIQIALGSDSGVGLRIPGVAEHLELALMVEAGLTPMQAITTLPPRPPPH
jgi:imidazolonepropionase-like amidohydrolase